VPGTFPRKSDAFEAAQEAEVIGRRRPRCAAGPADGPASWGDWWTISAETQDFDSDTPTTERNTIRKLHQTSVG
jgi:hypothetical protein